MLTLLLYLAAIVAAVAAIPLGDPLVSFGLLLAAVALFLFACDRTFGPAPTARRRAARRRAARRRGYVR